MNCKVNLEKYKDRQSFAFKTAEINTEDNDIYLSKINDILLINIQEEKKKKDYKVIIIVIVVCGVLLLSGISILLYCIIKRRNLNKNNELNNTEKKDIKNIDNDNKVIQYANDQNIQQVIPKSHDELNNN